MNQVEFEELLADTTKKIHGNIIWKEQENHHFAVEFRVEVVSQHGYPLFIKGRYHPGAQKLSYTLIHRSLGRIYALDMGKEHRNPLRNKVGRIHKHRWKEQFKDKEAYLPEDITAPVTDPVAVWQQFCTEARITHDGVMQAPPFQMELL